MNENYRPNPERSASDRRDSAPESRLSRELTKSLFLEACLVDGGQDGIIFKLNAGAMDTEYQNILTANGISIEAESAIKMLKVYRPGTAFKEFSAQQKAHEILTSTVSGAKVPKPYLFGAFETDGDLNMEMPESPGQDASELIVMEWVSGSDIETQLYRKATQLLNPEQDLENMALETMRVEVAMKLNYVNEVDERGAIPYTRTVTGNSQRLMRFFAQHGVFVSPHVIEQIHGACHSLNREGIFHNDLHGRNIIVNGDIFSVEDPGTVYIIDFGRSKHGDEVDQQLRDDEAIARTLSFANIAYEDFTKKKESERAEAQRNRIEDKRGRADKIHEDLVMMARRDPDWKEKRKAVWGQISPLIKRINAHNEDLLLEEMVTILTSQVDTSNLDMELGQILDLAGFAASKNQVSSVKLKNLLLSRGKFATQIKLYMDYHQHGN
jgi:tRNA A-37 threonylcarbamoyl transferase component Bud32